MVIRATLAPCTTLYRTVFEKAECALDELPGLNADYKDNSEADHEGPLPLDASVLEELVVENGDIDDREDGESAENDGPEQELVAVQILEDGKAAVIVGIEAKHGAAETLELPGRNENQPGEFGKCGSAGAEDGLARFRVVRVAVHAEVSVVGAVDDDDEGAHGACSHHDTIDDHIDDDLVGEDTALLVLRRLAHDILRGLLSTETKGRERRGNHVDPDDLERRDGEYGETASVDESQTGNQENHLTYIRGEQVKDEFLNVVEHAATLADSGHDGVELVVGKHNLGGGLGNIRARSHGDTDICAR
mgnify:CR=1 FL=1